MKASSSRERGRLAVYGDYVGGGLAAMLALTECRAGSARVVAAALSNGVLDWVDVGDSPLSGDSSASLLQLRKDFFTKPAHYFDPFASPLLFLESPGQDAPPTAAEEPWNDLEQLSLLDREDFFREQLALSGITTKTATSPAAAESLQVGTSRRTSRRYPLLSSNLRLPSFHVETEADSPLHDQASAFVKRLRQSFMRTSGGNKFGRKVLEYGELGDVDEGEAAARKERTADAARRAQLVVTRGGEKGVEGAARWLRDVLR